MINESLQQWVQDYRLNAIIFEDTFIIEGIGKFLIVQPKNDILFDKKFTLELSSEEFDIMMEDTDIAYYAFQFGERWYYCDDIEITELKELKYLGKEVEAAPEGEMPFLGVHGAYDLCNGSRSYADWCKKAKFINCTTLGIAEDNTLAGTLAFQVACQKAGIHPVIGETVTVEDTELERYNVKLYCENAKGWRNLLLINSQINVFNDKFVTEKYLLEHGEGLYCVLNPETDLRTKLKLFDKAAFTKLFFQFDVSQWDSDDRDKKFLLATKNYLEKYKEKLPVILINDAYYLEKADARIRKDLNAIGKVSFKFQSKDQYFKSPNDILSQILPLFSDTDESIFDLIEQGKDNARLIANSDFHIDTGKLHLPAFQLNEEEKKLYSTSEDLFWTLIDKGLAEKVEAKGIDPEPYIARIKEEAAVITGANLHDYFLTTWRILNWSRSKGWMTGYGRGSAAGCLIAYLLGIVQTNPFDYDLLFERFLNEGRLYKYKKVQGYVISDGRGYYYAEQAEQPTQDIYDTYSVKEEEITIKVTGSMPDIDNDVCGEHRDDIKGYIEELYGKDRVASIGTYGTLKIKGALKSLARRYGADGATTNYMTGAIADDDITFTGLFKEAQATPLIKGFIQKHPELIEKIPLVFNQPVTASTHAAGVIIVPEAEFGIYEQLPVKLVEGVLVSEWEDDYVEMAGFLKLDILGLKQLDKFGAILQLIKDSTGEEIELTEIPLDDAEVFEMFGKGYNEDVFQFKGHGLKGYTAELKPETIHDLIATVALYRPGPIDTGAHMQYVHRKNGQEPVVFQAGTEEILKETYGLMCYQEQVMKIAEHLAGFTKNEADDVRKAIGKKIPELMAEQKNKFIEGAVKRNYVKQEMEWLWDQIEVFAAYSFNKSHAACYAITGYLCQWFKVNYPLQFWTVSLKYAKIDAVPAILSEIYSTSNITISPVDINKSQETYEMDAEKDAIYWTITSVSQVGVEAVKAIMAERDVNGEFFSIEEFAQRMKPFGRAVKKNTIINLITAGAFDELHSIKHAKQRFEILERYMIFRKSELEETELEMKGWKDYQWTLKQRELSGLGLLDFKKLAHSTNLAGKIGKYQDNKAILETPVEELPEEVLIGGVVTKFIVRGDDRPFATIELTDGQTIVAGVIWSDTFLKHRELFDESPINKLIILTAAIKYDHKFKKANVFNTTKLSSLIIVE